ncbi:hypothetical protein AAGC94_19930 [Clostridium sporogenes]|uniref:hypothetical protein n=2 Tax=Bacteria TaxID=2 RepID=UPI00313BB484
MAIVALGIVEVGLDLAVGDNTSAAVGLLFLFPMGKGFKYVTEIGGDAVKGGSKAKNLYKAEGLLEMNLQKFGKVTSKLSQGKVNHILKNHSYNNMKVTVDKLKQKGLKDTAEKLLKDKSFFNPKWSQKQIIEATETAYNKLLNKGISHGEHSVEVFGETINVYMENGVFRSAYGNYKFKLSDFGS